MSQSPATAPLESTGAPARAPLVLGTLILVSGVANLNLSVANVALPSIGDAFDSSQTSAQPDRGRLLLGPGRAPCSTWGPSVTGTAASC